MSASQIRTGPVPSDATIDLARVVAHARSRECGGGALDERLRTAALTPMTHERDLPHGRVGTRRRNILIRAAQGLLYRGWRLGWAAQPSYLVTVAGALTTRQRRHASAVREQIRRSSAT